MEITKIRDGICDCLLCVSPEYKRLHYAFIADLARWHECTTCILYGHDLPPITGPVRPWKTYCRKCGRPQNLFHVDATDWRCYNSHMRDHRLLSSSPSSLRLS